MGGHCFPRMGKNCQGRQALFNGLLCTFFWCWYSTPGISLFSSAIPQAVPEIIRTDFTVLQTAEVDFKKNQKFLFFVFLVYSWVTCSRKILILLATACHLDLNERSVKVRILYKFLHILSGWHFKTRDCGAVNNLLFSIWHFDNFPTAFELKLSTVNSKNLLENF